MQVLTKSVHSGTACGVGLACNVESLVHLHQESV